MSSGSLSTSSTDPQTPQLVPAGRVGRPHGLAGAFHVTKPRIRALKGAASVVVDGTERTIERLGGTAERPVVELSGIGTREAAESLRGADLFVDRDLLGPLGEDEWYAEDLVGCQVGDGGRAIGVVTALHNYPSCDLLEVDRAGGALLVPLIGDAVRSVDIEAKEIDVNGSFLGLGDDDAA